MPELAETLTQRRRVTRNSIYQYLYNAKEPRAKQEIAAALGLSLPTVHQNLTELTQAGLIRQGGAQQSTGGRRAMGLTVQENARFAVGISLTEDRLRLLAADLKLQELAYYKTERFAVQDEPDLGRRIARELEQFLQQNSLPRQKLLGVGITVPGVIDPARQRIQLSPTLPLRDTDLSALTRWLDLPCHVENDATSGGYAEWFSRQGQGNMAYLSLENGVGGAVLLAGAPYPGDNRRSGEFGHMCVEPGGLPCKCGKQGCLEAYCSAARLSNDLGITLEDFFEGLGAGNATHQALWNDLLQHLAIGVNNLRMVLDCDIVLGGFLTQYMEPYMPQLRGYVAARNMFEQSADYLRLCRHTRRAGPLGGALHYIQKFIEEI